MNINTNNKALIKGTRDVYKAGDNSKIKIFE